MSKKVRNFFTVFVAISVVFLFAGTASAILDHALDVHGKNNCIFLDDSVAARTNIPAGDYIVKVSGDAFYLDNFSHGKVFIRYASAEHSSKDYLEALTIGQSTILHLRDSNPSGGYGFYAFFADWSDLNDNSGTVTLEFQGIVLTNDLVTFDPDSSTYEFTPDTTDCQAGAVGKFTFDATLTNISEKKLSNLHVEVDELTNDNLLLTDKGLIGEGESFEVPNIDDYADGILSNEEFADVPFTVCLQEKSPFRFFVNVLGVAKNPAPVPKTGQTVSYASGDDGELQKGVPWPDPRFTDNGDGTVTDHLTGQTWLKNANCFGEKNWNDALDASNNLAGGQCGLSDGSSPGDWRLPNVRELRSLIDHSNYNPPLPSGHLFTDVQFDHYWSSTTVAYRTGEAWNVLMNSFGGFVHNDKRTTATVCGQFAVAMKLYL